jgi:predicted DCC family thiol-disulfide oxidoreductase YuxK
VQFVLRHEREHSLRFAPLESELGRAIRLRHPQVANIDSMIWVDAGHAGGERVLVRSAAGLRAAQYLGGPWRLAALARLIPRPIRDAVYDLIARHRHRIVAGDEQCYLPPPSVRARFLG